jgi:hypothetical protein
MNQILVITSKNDPHADYVIEKFSNKVYRQCEKNTFDIVRLNTEDLLTNLEIYINPKLNQVHIKIIDSGKIIDGDKVISVWFRRPNHPTVSHIIDDIQSYALQESLAVLDGIYTMLGHAFWVSHPSNLRRASNKFRQLVIANKLEFLVPNTLITNNNDDVGNLLKNCGKICIKALRQPFVDFQKKRQPLLNKVIDNAAFSEIYESIPVLPSQYQEFIHKKYDLRVICIGDKYFSFAIYSQENLATKEDFRGIATGLRHELIDIPTSISENIRKFMNHEQLNFSAFDFAVTDDNKYYFLENNPNGQWLWLELETGIDISSSLIDLLINPPQKLIASVNT